MRRLTIFCLIISMLAFGISCGVLMLRYVECYDISEDLKLFPGNVQDSLVLSDRKGKKTVLKIIEKIAKHTTGYITDAGCSCYDYWRVEIRGSDVSIVFATALQYIETTEGTREEALSFTTSKGTYSFIEAKKSFFKSYVFDGVKIQDVIEYCWGSAYPTEYRKVYLAKNIGIVRLITSNGDTLTNDILAPLMNSGIETWDYSDGVCE